MQILDRGLEVAPLEVGSDAALPTGMPTAPVTDTADVVRWLNEGAAAVSLEPSAAYRQAHPAAAVWSIRPRLERLPTAVLKADRIILLPTRGEGQLAAVDLAG